MTKRLAVIDGKSIFYRGYYSMPNLSLPDGTPTGGVYGFASLAIELIKQIKPDYVAVAWDKRGTNIRKRKQIYPDYKAGRKPAPDDFYEQIPILCELLDAFGWPFYEIDDYEADDIMGAFAKEASQRDVETYLITSDLDALQVIGPKVKVYAVKKGFTQIEEFDIDHFEQKYGIKIDQFLDYKALIGDSSDNIPGVAGIGPKTATELLNQYETLDGIYDNLSNIKPTIATKLSQDKDRAYMSKDLARIWSEAPVKLDWDIADVNDTDLNKVAQILKRLEFNSLVRRLPDYMKLDQQSEVVNLKDLPKNLDKMPKLDLAESILIHLDDDNLIVSTDKSSYFTRPIDDKIGDLVDIFQDKLIITHDGKTLLHKLAELYPEIGFNKVFDINQASFLIDPLSRDRSLSKLADMPTEDIPSTVLALWTAYESLNKQLADEPKLSKIAREFDFPLINILFRMEQKGIKIDPSKLADMSVRLKKEYDDLEQQIHELVGYEFNIASPAQLSEALFTKLQLPTAGIKKGKTAYSTGQKELAKLRLQHPVIKLVERTRELAKLRNTYIDVLPELVDDNNRIHTTFNQDTVITGRLSSTNPNLQNIPIRQGLGREIRQAFVPDKNNVFVGADYSQFELRLAAVLANDRGLIEDFNNDVDIHTKTASQVYKIPMEEVTSDQRRHAKVINFGVLYGMSPHGLSVATDMSLSEAKQFIDEYFTLRQPIRQFIDDTLENARRSGHVETYFGRKRPTPDLNSSNFMVRSGAERAAANMPIQGTEADLMKLAMIAVDKKVDGLGEQILQVHDSILIECPESNADKISKILRETMEGIAPELGVKLKVDIKIGNNWGEL